MLQDFAYRIESNGMVFLMAFGITLSIVMMTMEFYTLKVATTKPVDAIRPAE